MKCHSVKLCVLFQVILSLSGVLIFAGTTSAQQLSGAVAESTRKTTGTAIVSSKELSERKKQLIRTKQVNKWPNKGTIGPTAVELTPQECTILGGIVIGASDCTKTGMKCHMPNTDRAMCVDELV